jgi:AcrR family transcriptional regulator
MNYHSYYFRILLSGLKSPQEKGRNSMEKPSRKEREYQLRREEILTAAERVFAQNGFHNSTVAQIAREAEFAIGTLYQFFANKEELYYTMMIEKFDLLYTTLKQGLEHKKSCAEKLNCLVHLVLSFIEANADFFKIFTWELNVLQPAMEDRLKDELLSKHFSYIELISGVVKQGMREGVIKQGNIEDFSSALVGMMNVFSFNWIFDRQRASLKDKAPVIVNLFLRGTAA